MSVHTDDAGVSVASVISSVAAVFNGDDHPELIEGGVDVPVPCWPHSFVVSSTNSYVNWDHGSSFMSRSWSLVCLDLVLRAGMVSTSLPDLRRLVPLVSSMQWTS